MIHLIEITLIGSLLGAVWYFYDEMKVMKRKLEDIDDKVSN